MESGCTQDKDFKSDRVDIRKGCNIGTVACAVQHFGFGLPGCRTATVREFKEKCHPRDWEIKDTIKLENCVCHQELCNKKDISGTPPTGGGARSSSTGTGMVIMISAVIAAFSF